MGFSKDKVRFVMVLCAIFCVVFSSIAQAQDVPRDTSYTLRSTLAKVQKYHKDIDVSGVYSNPPKNIRSQLEKVYKTIGNRELTLNLLYPKVGRKGGTPILVMIHGGGWRAGDKSLMTPMAEQFAEAGYMVVVPEYRLSLEAAYPSAVLDIYDMIGWAKKNAKRYGANSSQVAILGCSAGGQLAALVGNTYHKDIFRENGESRQPLNAILDIDGVLAFHHPDSKESKVAAEWLGGFYDEVPDAWEEASALNHVDATSPPTLFLASMYPRFLAGRQEYMDVLEQNNIYTETQFFKNAPHSFWLLNPWFKPTMDYTLTFLEKIFKP